MHSDYPADLLVCPEADAPRERYAAHTSDDARRSFVTAQLQYRQIQRQLRTTRLDRCDDAVQTAFRESFHTFDALLREHVQRWTAHLPAGAAYHFGRGCIETVTASASWWLQHGAAVCALEPILGLTLQQITPAQLAAVLPQPQSAQWIALELHCASGLDTAAVDALIATVVAAAPPQLTWLSIRNAPLQLAHYETLARALRPERLLWVGLPELHDFPSAGDHFFATDEAIIEDDWNHGGRLIEWYTSPLVTHLDQLAGVAPWRHFQPADWKRLLPPPMTLFAAAA